MNLLPHLLLLHLVSLTRSLIIPQRLTNVVQDKKQQPSKFISLPSEIKHSIIAQLGLFGDVLPGANTNQDPDSINHRIMTTTASRESDSSVRHLTSLLSSTSSH